MRCRECSALRIGPGHEATLLPRASRPEQVKENLKAIDVLPRLTPMLMDRILEIVAPHDDR
mgnify:CR=1 FL=1